MHRIILSLLLLVPIATSAFSQSNDEITLGDSYEQVIEKIENEPGYEFLKIIKSPDKIVKYNDPLGPLAKINVVWEFHFKNQKLVQIFMINDPPNLDRAISGMYRLLLEQNTTVTVVKKNGHRAYHYTTPKGETYIYRAFSDWFQKTCEFTVIEKSD